MPKTAKTSSTVHHRSAPYTVSTTQPIAPALAPAPTMSTHAPPSPIPSRHDRNAGPWDSDSDEKLMQARQRGLNWQPIAAQFFPDKTANACRKRHERLMEKRHATEDWGDVKVEAMSKAYLEVREEMWKMLADRIPNAKWQTVETKCMEKGLKTLHSIGKTAQRRERLQTGGDHSDVSQEPESHSFNDSGINLSSDNPFPPHDQGQHQRASYYSSFHHEPSSYAAGPGTVTPPYTHPGHRSYSHSSASTIPTTSPFTTVSNSSPHQRPQPLPQPLPSFSSTFGSPSVPVVQHPINRRSPHHNPIVTTQL
ncbi:hypothetical protein ACLMJK_006879 [Lecanora helva]